MSITVPEPSLNLVFSLACLGVAGWAFLVARGTIEFDRWPYDTHPEVAYIAAGMALLIAVISIASGF